MINEEGRCDFNVIKIMQLAKQAKKEFNRISKFYSPKYEKEYEAKVTPIIKELQ